MIYKRINIDDDVQTIDQEVTTGLWTGDTGSLVNFYYSTTQLAKNNSKYFVDVYNSDPATTSSAEVQFSIAYGNRTGLGSPTLNQDDNSTLATQGVYAQMRNILLDPEDSQFIFYAGNAKDEIYAVVVSRARFKGYVDPGNWQLTLSGSNGVRTFIDDSSQTLGTRRSFAKNGLVFNVVSGSISGVSGSTIAGYTGSASQGFGLFYPQMGIIILNPDEIQETVGFTPRASGLVGIVSQSQSGENTGSATAFVAAADLVDPLRSFTASLAGTGGVYSDQYNWHGLYRSMVLGADFQARSAEIIASTHYFLRLNSKDYNYSNNPSYATGSTGAITNADFEERSGTRTFVTSVGLYNDSNELLAVAKLSRPLEKSFAKEALLRVRLDF